MDQKRERTETAKGKDRITREQLLKVESISSPGILDKSFTSNIP